MEVEKVGVTGNLNDTESMLKFSQNCGRICYSDKDFEDLMGEKVNHDLIARMINSGHHSVFEHINFTFYLKELPKALAMILNNERQYATSEKSARYTQMSDIEPEQRNLYDKWMGILIPEIDAVYPETGDFKKRAGAIKKLAQENARYMTSVFTLTKMAYTINLRQLNFLRSQFKNFINQEVGTDDFKKRLVPSMTDFLEQTEAYKILGLENQTDRHLSFFRGHPITPEVFSDVYSTFYPMSFAGLAQAHRHRTIKYDVSKGTESEFGRAPLGFFVPGIVEQKSELKKEWLQNLTKVAEHDYPQATLLQVHERGALEDFRSKMILRMCGHAQWEIMKNTSQTAEKYSKQYSNFDYPLTPKCQQGIKCAGSCVWGGEKALERIV